MFAKKQAQKIPIPYRITEQREKVKNELMKHIVVSERCYDIICMGPKAFLNLRTLLQDRGGLTHT